MRSNATTAWDYLDGCVFIAHRRGPLVDADFGDFLTDMLRQRDVHRVLVRGSEGAPGPHHRAALLRWYKENSVRGAVLTDSLLTRGGVTALGWFGVNIRAFGHHELESAFDYVEIPLEHRFEARTMLQRVIAQADAIR